MLQIIRTKENLLDKNSDRYLKAIIKECESENITYEIVTPENEYELKWICAKDNPKILLEPIEYDKPQIKNNLETNVTAQVVRDLCNQYKNKTVLIINRSDLIGKPLANMLLQDDFTVCIAHSKTTESHLRRLIIINDIVILATGHKLTEIDLRDKIVIDISDDYNSESVRYHSMKEIGKLTVKKLIENYKASK